MNTQKDKYLKMTLWKESSLFKVQSTKKTKYKERKPRETNIQKENKYPKTNNFANTI